MDKSDEEDEGNDVETSFDADAAVDALVREIDEEEEEDRKAMEEKAASEFDREQNGKAE